MASPICFRYWEFWSLGGLEDFAAQFCDTLSRSTDFTAAITDRDSNTPYMKNVRVVTSVDYYLKD